jgi:hypothetical protein
MVAVLYIRSLGIDRVTRNPYEASPAPSSVRIATCNSDRFTRYRDNGAAEFGKPTSLRVADDTLRAIADRCATTAKLCLVPANSLSASAGLNVAESIVLSKSSSAGCRLATAASRGSAANLIPGCEELFATRSQGKSIVFGLGIVIDPAAPTSANFEPALSERSRFTHDLALIQRDRAFDLATTDLLIFVRGRSRPSMRGDLHSFVWVGVHPWDSNPRPADYEAENPPLTPSVLVGNRPVWPRLLVQFGGFWMGNWMGRTMIHWAFPSPLERSTLLALPRSVCRASEQDSSLWFPVMPRPSGGNLTFAAQSGIDPP